jgi:hypothetical protein
MPPNRYTTPVKVWFHFAYESDDSWEHFSDVQMAYLRIQRYIEETPRDWYQLPEFEAFADSLDNSTDRDEYGRFVSISCNDIQILIYYNV